MKKSVIIIIAIVLIIAVVGIVYFMINGNTQELPSNNQTQKGQTNSSKYQIQYEGKNMTPGEVFSKQAHGEPQSQTEIPSCAFQGTDNVYTYEAYEVTTSQIEGQEKVYSVYLSNDLISTPEGVKISDEKSAMITAYGEDYQENGTEYIYTDGNVNLSFITENDVIISIQYTMVTE